VFPVASQVYSKISILCFLSNPTVYTSFSALVRMADLIDIKTVQAKDQVAALIPDASRARVEIEEFLGDNDMTNLCLLALEAMQKEDATKSVAKNNEDWWTFYSLSGESKPGLGHRSFDIY
jgi:hypothetical protein